MSAVIIAWRRQNLTDLKVSGQQGDFSLYRDTDNNLKGMHFLCPCGCGNISHLNFDPQVDGPCWTMTGDLNKPTVRPSVHQTGLPCGWHGWLTGGVWVDT